ncbi:hypothetical protein [Thermus tengchongensis]|uniref:hypothetical protein n=1 Tax=Thermus tengchongensis TaxID=1214928 RepID=UPI001F43B879|nr:hypothetical protein [Thermus tengchongensis]
MIPTWRTRTLVVPSPVGVPEPPLGVFPSGRESHHHVAGEVRGARAVYGDLNAFAWYYGGGYLTLNRGRKRIARTARGGEDAKRRQG